MSGATREAAGSDPAAVPRRFERYVAIGDSSTEGLDDPDGRGGYRGWANRLAEHVARQQERELFYANLAVRGRRTRRILEEQLGPAMAMKPDLATVFAGTNDAVARRFDVVSMAADMERMQRALIAGGATVITFTLPDLTAVMPFARRIAPRLEAMNEALRQVASSTGALLVDFAAHPVASDRRLWSGDRLHANSLGHERIAAALAHALRLPGADESWIEPLPAEAPRTFRQRVLDEAEWGARYLVPWLWRHARGRSSGDGRQPKRPTLLPMEVQRRDRR